MTGREDPTGGVDVASIRAILGDPLRLQVLRVVYEAGGPTSVRAVAEAVSGSRSPSAVADDLHHRHLPVLDGAGWVRYDPERGTIEPSDPEDVRNALADVSALFDDVADAID